MRSEGGASAPQARLAALAAGLSLLLLTLGTSTASADPSQCVEFPEGQGSESVEAYYQPEDVDKAVADLEQTGRGVSTSVIGLSNRARPIHSVRLGEGATVVFLQAGIHANEPTGTTALINLLKDLSNTSPRSQEIREALTIVAIPQLNPDGSDWYQRENDQTWQETVAMFPQLAGRPPAFYHSLPGPRFWADPRVAGFDLNRDFNPDFGYVPQPGHLPGSGSVRGMYLTPEARASRDLYASLEREFGTVDVFVDLHNQAPCNTFDDGDPDTPDLHTPLSISAQFLRDPAAHGAGTTYPKFDYDASRRANVAAWEGTQRGGSTFSGVTRYPQDLNLAGSANSSYQLRGSASVLMEAGRQRHANPQWRHGFIAKVHELAMRGIIDSLVDGTFDDIDPARYEQIPIRN
jgi:predicted deacylase